MTLVHGDCLAMLPRVASASVDLVLADLPYAHMQAGRVRRCTRNPWDAPIDLTALWAELLRVGKPACTYIFTATQPFASVLVAAQPTLFRYDLIFEKSIATGFLNARVAPLRAHESMLVFYQSRGTYNPQKTRGHPLKRFFRHRPNSGCYGKMAPTHYTSTDERYPRSVLYFDADRKKRVIAAEHPTQKPLALFAWLIATYTNPGDVVLDPTCGGGTTAVAAIQTGRRWICVEREAAYVAVAARRIRAARAATQKRLTG